MKKSKEAGDRVCPACGASVTPKLARSYWGTITAYCAHGVTNPRVQAECCGKKLTQTQVKKLLWPTKEAASAHMREVGAQRIIFGAGSGRPQVMTKCPKCGKKFGGRELRVHKPRCQGRE